MADADPKIEKTPAEAIVIEPGAQGEPVQETAEPRAKRSWLRPLLMSEVPARFKEPGTWMNDALALRDRWESRLLRSVDWSPWY